MVSWMISRVVVLVFGMLYPAYYSYKAVKTKNVKEYVRWMMYWIVFALYTVIETVADQTLAWFPLEIDDYIVQAKERGYETMVNFGRQGLNLAAAAAVTAAVKRISGLLPHLYFNHFEPYGIPLKDGREQTDEEAEGPFSDDEMVTHKGLRRTQSMKSVKTIKGRKEVRYGSLKYKVKKRPQVYF
ncbi:Receptor expression-enhancing protein 3 [Apodemus speciosus]|uniref:Receptor expression-enhancing protein n=1 Tax=Apodemus speciosus TaxID=105296 RepID=A0ABQ0F7E9_APOSI